ncbi:hypothetical protein PAXRUDRAFT_822109 [Paxillus rubicundulus Ve08.2h10]|uniref:Unplaced genomic scaffold scaffold_22, whole genome shotgun sequence n=1 Tax=Paxillus rubicundulus Ve08.2h10 TaxID=930991 RepID=A0A0D0E5N0_9AGAM|nr:hypothetical protein PAXRUDRAFT_822109 [Paxillus rubicundulus Ve08.2h10]
MGSNHAQRGWPMPGCQGTLPPRLVRGVPGSPVLCIAPIMLDSAASSGDRVPVYH